MHSRGHRALRGLLERRRREAAQTLHDLEMLRTIDDAIRRLEHGGYSVCADCGLEIGARRLEALPFAVRCSGCQARREAAERVRQDHNPDDASRRDLSTRPRIRSMYLSQGAHPRSNWPGWKEGP